MSLLSRPRLSVSRRVKQRASKSRSTSSPAGLAVTYSVKSTYTNLSLWSNFNTTDAVSPTSPPDAGTAYRVTENSANNFHTMFRSETGLTIGKRYRLELSANANSRTWVLLGLDIAGNQRGTFDISNGVVGQATQGSPTLRVVSDQGSGWFLLRIEVEATGTSGNISLGLATSASTTSYAGDGSSNADFFKAVVYEED